MTLTLVAAFAGAQNQASSPLLESALAARVRALNNGVLQLHEQVQQASENSADYVRGQAGPVLAQRAAALRNLIRSEPRTALTFAFSPELLADLSAKFPSASSQLEQHVTLQGHLERWVEDSADLKTSHTYSFLKTGTQTLSLHFAGPEPNVKSGEVLEVTGVVVGSEMAISAMRVMTSNRISLPRLAGRLPSPFSASLVVLVLFALFALAKVRRLDVRVFVAFRQLAVCASTLALVLFSPMATDAQNTCSTTGVQHTIVILATFPGVTPPSSLTPQSVSQMFFGATPPSVNNYWQEASYGTTSATGDVFGWFTLTGNYTSCALPSLQTDAMSAAAAAGANFLNYNRVVVIFPDTLGCGWAGFSNIGCSSLTTPNGTIAASSSYITTANAIVQVATHELGHGLGLSHASSRGFTDSTGSPIPLGPLGATGSLIEYGDSFSTMACCEGNVGGEYGAPHKAERLGWLPPGTGYETIQSSGTYTLQPYETQGGLKAIKVQRGTGNNAWLWVEYRQPDGFYDPSSFPNPLNTGLPPQPYSGALIHYEDSITGLYTHLINYTPSDKSFFSPALVQGQTWADPYSNVSISVLSATSSGLTVSVSYGAVPCTSSSPTVSVSPLDPSIYPGQTASYSASITNNDSSGCSSSTISLGSSEPSGWSTSFSPSSMTLSPGQSASVTMGKGAPAGTPVGTYPVNLSASSTSSTSLGTANATVMAAPSLAVTVSTNATTFVPPSTVAITASVTNGETPASGSAVTFSLKAPNGSTITQTATTGTNGIATWNYRLNSKSPAGTYSASAQAALSSGSGGRKSSTSASSQTAISNTVSFAVQ